MRKCVFVRQVPKRAGLALFFVLAAMMAAPATADILEGVRERGVVRCAVDGTPGFGSVDPEGRPVGFDVDFCRAVAAAVLGHAEAVQIERINTANKFRALVRGEVDIAFGMATWTLDRDTTMGVRFVAPTFFDGQGLMVWADGPIGKLSDARGKRVCVQAGTTSAANLASLSRARGLDLKLVESSSSDDRLNRFMRRDCELLSGDRSELASRRATRILDPSAWRMLDETLSREPLGPYVRQDDDRWFSIVRWVINVTQIAEHHGATAVRLQAVREDAGRELLRLAGKVPGFGESLGLDDAWAYRVVTQVGHYADLFERNVGRGSPLRLERGFNRLWTNGGLFFPPPL